MHPKTCSFIEALHRRVAEMDAALDKRLARILEPMPLARLPPSLPSWLDKRPLRDDGPERPFANFRRQRWQAPDPRYGYSHTLRK